MPSEDYRYYHQEGDGRIHFAEWISAVDDEQAVEHVRANYPDSKCEIWKGRRLVAELLPAGFSPDDQSLQDNVAKRVSRLALQRKSGSEG